MTQRIETGELQIARELFDFINDEALPGTGIGPDDFWSGLAVGVERDGARAGV